MMSPLDPEQCKWECTPELFPRSEAETEIEQLEIGAARGSYEAKEKKRKAVGPDDGGADQNFSSAPFNTKRETSGDDAQREPGAEFIVWWDEPIDQDPENPMNWSLSKKWVNILTISTISFLV